MLTDCSRCNAIVDAKVHAQYESYEPDLRVPERFTFAECPRCQCPFLLYQNKWYDHWDRPSRLYPSKDDFVGWTVPEPLRNAFAEAARCFNSKAFTATMIMCRKTLEGVCADQKATGKTLKQKLKSLRENGAIEGKLYEWANELRIAGNEAAHDIDIEIDAQDAGDVLAFTRALLDYAYTFRHRFYEFKERRESARGGRGVESSSAG